jgi:glycosyltransferase involved in cell wall biosynthesis
VAEDAGFVVPPRDSKALADVIYQFFNNPNRANFGQSLRSLAEEKYAWPVIIKQLEEIYQQLLVV